MEANEAPEKIYVERFDVDEEEAKFDKSILFFDDIWVEEPELSQNYVEYTRTDAFVEKACEYLEPIIFSMNLGDRQDTDKFIEDFKNYMKGE